jgi:hypothetical protein
MITTFVKRGFLIFVLDCNKCACINEFFCNICEAPKASIMKCRVPMLVDAVDIGLVS